MNRQENKGWGVLFACHLWGAAADVVTGEQQVCAGADK